MNILIVYNKYLYYGGEDTYFTLIRELLIKKGHRVFIYTEDSKTIGNSLWEKIVTGLKLFYNFSLSNKLDLLIKKRKIDAALILNIYPLIGNSLYWYLKKRKIKIIQRIANYRYLCPKTSLFRNGTICEKCPISNSIFPSIVYGCYHKSRIATVVFVASFYFHKLIKSFNFIDAFMFPSVFTANKHIANKICNKENTFIIPTFFNDYDRKIQKNKIKKGIIYAGRLVQEKGVLDLLSIASKIPTTPITIVGEGPLKKDVIESAKKNKNIKYLPFLERSQLLNELSKNKALVIPSLWYDVLPNIVIESYFTNTLVIAPNIGPFHDIIKNYRTGALYTYASSASFINAIKYILKSRVNYDKFFEEERKKYISKEHYGKFILMLKTIKI